MIPHNLHLQTSVNVFECLYKKEPLNSIYATRSRQCSAKKFYKIYKEEYKFNINMILNYFLSLIQVNLINQNLKGKIKVRDLYL